MDVETLKPGSTDYHISHRGEIEQPHAVGRSCQVEAELPDSATKDTFLPDLGVKIPEDNLDVMCWAFNVQNV